MDSTTPPSSCSRIPIHVANKKAYIWSVEAMRQLRVNHHICGVLTGTLPGITQQNMFLGLPLLLLPEEVVLLVENGIADIIDDVRSVRQPTAAELELETSAILDDMAAQQRAGEVAEAARRAQLEAIPKSEAQLAKMAARKAKAAEEEERRRRAAEAAAATAGDGPGSEEDLVHVAAPSAKETTTAAAPQPLQSYTIAIETDSASHAYYDPSLVTYSTLAAARAAEVWSYPSTAAERARAGVFRALWERGYFMGAGIKFGGDLLVYPGDPLRYHSHFSSTAVLSADHRITPMELVAWGRLGTATKKAHLIAGWDDETGEADFYSLEWASF